LLKPEVLQNSQTYSTPTPENVAEILLGNPNLGGEFALVSISLLARKQFNDLVGGVVVWIHFDNYRRTTSSCQEENWD
jgi:hypothetical protein